MFHAGFVYNAKGDFKKMSMTAPHTAGNRFPCSFSGLGPGRGRRAHLFLQFRLAKKKVTHRVSSKKPTRYLMSAREGRDSPTTPHADAQLPPSLSFHFI